MLYVGPRPTIDNHGKNVFEVNIFDFNDNIYDEIVGVEIISKIREDQKFESLDLLKNQLNHDFKKSKEIIKSETEKLKQNALVTISILNYNGKKYLEQYLPSLMSSIKGHSAKVIIADNASTDDSIRFLRQNYKEIEIVELIKNYGFAEGYNKGNQSIKSKYTLLLNSDIKVSQDWLQPLISFMEENDKVASVMPKIRSLNDPNSFEYAGACGGFIDRLGYPFCRGRVFNHVEEDHLQYEDVVPVFWTSGAAMMVRTDLFHNLKGFDVDYFAHQEEIDFCWRLQNLGYDCYVVPASVVYHVGGGTLAYDSPGKTYLNFRNNLATIIKNERFPYFIFVFFIRLVLDGVAGIKFLFEGKYMHTLSIIKAHLSTYFRLLPILLKRKKNYDLSQKYSMHSNSNKLQKPFSILFEFYLKGKKTFSQITNK
jgi:GT2 family glycosyltransferase